MCWNGYESDHIFYDLRKKALRERKIPFMVDAPLKIDENDNYDD